MIDYKYKKKENKFTENGHTMFEEDVLQRLKRLAYLEEQIKQGQLLPIDSVSDIDAELVEWINETEKRAKMFKEKKYREFENISSIFADAYRCVRDMIHLKSSR